MKPSIRTWHPGDDLDALTEMLHRAYAPLAAEGLRYTATHQTPEVTLRRLSRGHALVAEIGGRVVGTLTVYQPDGEDATPAYREHFHFGQFGVVPEFKGRGIGTALHAAALDHVRSLGGAAMALDTASPASRLIALYERWGYEIIDRISYSSTNYESVVMRLWLQRPPAPAE
ncbi:MAG: putative N-acetyltransferase [Akkermansiaceae bacterium]|nr:putative N-acetyltransferase [Akkermansiaceae bacterium]